MITHISRVPTATLRTGWDSKTMSMSFRDVFFDTNATAPARAVDYPYRRVQITTQNTTIGDNAHWAVSHRSKQIECAPVWIVHTCDLKINRKSMVDDDSYVPTQSTSPVTPRNQ